MDTEAWAWLALSRLPRTGPATINRLLDTYCTPEQVITAGDDAWRRLGVADAARAALAELRRRGQRSAVARQATEDQQLLSRLGASLLTRNDPQYPARLAAIDQPPPLLYLYGSAERLSDDAVAVVGSRRASASGREIAAELAVQLGGAGLAISSGLALGIDAAAHHGAVQSGAVTLAVTGVGIDRVYPLRHRQLQQQIIAAGGVVISEFLPGTGPQASHFPRRNRIISGLSLGVVVVEAARRSGSLITARLALAQGREVFAVPGSIRNPQSAGCLQLLRDGARLVESAQDVLEELFGVSQLAPCTGREADSLVGVSADAALVYRAVDDAPCTQEELSVRTGLPPDRLQVALTELELLDYLAFASGAWERRALALGRAFSVPSAAFETQG